MSVYKWEKMHQLSILHDVQPYAYKGLEKCKDQFFVNLTEAQWKQWAQVTENNTNDDEEELLRPYKLTNPILNHQLQDILDDEQSDINTRKMLIQIIRIARHILNEGLPLRLLIDLGLMIKDKDSKVDYSTLAEWLRKLRFQQMAQLEGALLIELFGLETIDIPFAQGDVDKKTAIVAKELAEYTNVHKDFYFSQSPDSIFVHTSNSGALISHIKRSARYMRFIPSEALTNFFASFAHSLTHIEE
jgi:hypothetical protein